MPSSVLDPKSRLHVNSVMANESLFAPSNRSKLRDLDAVCIDFDRAIENEDDLRRCFQWIEEVKQNGLQVFLLGSRENLASVPELRQKDVTFIEKRGKLAEASQHQQAQVVDEMLEELYVPFVNSGAGYRNQKSSMSETAPPLKNSGKAIDPAYFEPILTDEQRKALFAFLRTPEGEGEFPPPGVENA